MSPTAWDPGAHCAVPQSAVGCAERSMDVSVQRIRQPSRSRPGNRRATRGQAASSTWTASSRRVPSISAPCHVASVVGPLGEPEPHPMRISPTAQRPRADPGRRRRAHVGMASRTRSSLATTLQTIRDHRESKARASGELGDRRANEHRLVQSAAHGSQRRPPYPWTRPHISAETIALAVWKSSVAWEKVVRNCGVEPAGELSSGRGGAPFLDALGGTGAGSPTLREGRRPRCVVGALYGYRR